MQICALVFERGMEKVFGQNWKAPMFSFGLDLLECKDLVGNEGVFDG